MAGIIMAGQTSNYNFDYPTSTDYVKDGATAIQELADDVDATLFTALGGDYPGLRLIKKQTIGSGVSSVTVTDAFSATYDSYRILWTGGTQSNTINLKLQLGAVVTNYFGFYVYGQFTATTVLGANDNATTAFTYAGGGDSSRAMLECDIYQPFLPLGTQIKSSSRFGTNYGTYLGLENSTTSHTAFTLIPASGTMTGGTIYVYGYGIS
jgi:hypothetical protein